jgi:hypothetical protein
MRTLFLSLFVLPILALLAAPSQAATPAPAPDLTGVWTGKISGKRYSQETDGTPVSVKYLVQATITQIDSDITIEATLTNPDGDESSYSLQGKTGNRVFWGFNGDSNLPILIVGKVAGKLPKLSISGKGTAADDVGGFSELKVSLKRSKTGVLGTSATGAAVAGATVTLKDRNGNSVSTETDVDGRYSLNVVGLAPPFLVKVDPLAGSDLYGIASAAGVANVTPLTTLILDMWYDVQDLGPVSTVFPTLDGTTPVPTALEISLIEALVRRTILKWLQDNGIDPDSFNLLNSPFDADGTGVDAVLDITAVTGDATLTVDDGTTSQTSSIDVNEISGSVTIDTTTTSPGGTTMSTDGTVIPDGSASQAAVAGALATMEAFRAKINSRGAALTAADVQVYGTTDMLNEGDTRTWFMAQVATDMRGSTLAPFSLKAIRAFDGDAGTLGLDLEVHMSNSGESGTELFRMNYKKTGSTWLMYGDRQIASTDVKVEYRTDYLPSGIDGPRKSVNVDVRAPKDTIASVKVTGGGVFDNTDCPKDSHTEIMTLEPTPGNEVEYLRDTFFANTEFVEFPAPGTPFTVTVTPVTGTPQEYTIYSAGTTTETVSILQPTGNSLATDATPGESFASQWTLPTTFAIRRFQFAGHASSANFECKVEPAENLEIGDTLGTLTYPTTCGGETVISANFNLSFDGPNGERIMIIYEFNDF